MKVCKKGKNNKEKEEEEEKEKEEKNLSWKDFMIYIHLLHIT